MKLHQPLIQTSYKEAKSGIYIFYFDFMGCEYSYIGSTFDFWTRRNSHLSKLRKGKHHSPKFQEAFNTCGEGLLVYEELEELKFPLDYSKKLRKAHLESRENFWQNYFNSYLGELKGGETIWNDNWIGKKLKNNLTKTIYVIDSKHNIKNTYFSLREASRQLGIDASKISKACKLQIPNINGILFRYEDTLNKDYINVPKEIKPSVLLGQPKFYNRKAIDCYKIDGSFYKSYDSIIDITNDLGVPGYTVSHCCLGDYKYHKDYVFAYKGSTPVFPDKVKKSFGVNVYKNGELLGTFKNCTKAGEFTNISRSVVHYYCKNPGIKNEFEFKYNN